MISFFAEITEYTPPPGTDESLARIMFYAVFIAAVSTVIKQWTPKPALVEQLETLKNWVAKYFTSRTRHDALENRVDDHKSEEQRRFSEVENSIKGLREEMIKGHGEIKKAGEDRQNKLGDQIYKIGIENANGIGELRGQIRKMQS